VTLADAEHFVRAPEWTWYILFYFFLAGCRAVVLRSPRCCAWRRPEDEPAARSARTWRSCAAGVPGAAHPRPRPAAAVLAHAGQHRPVHGPIFKYWSPMSVGAVGRWSCSAIFATAVLDALSRRGCAPPCGRAARGVGRLWHLRGAVPGCSCAGYTGVLLAVSNQPIWSGHLGAGGLFLASGLRVGRAASAGCCLPPRPTRQGSDRAGAAASASSVARAGATRCVRGAADPAGCAGRAFAFRGLLLWIVAVVELLPGLAASSPGPGRRRRDLRRPRAGVTWVAAARPVGVLPCEPPHLRAS
jgi:hypothetical protein